MVTFADISGQTLQTIDIASDVEPGSLFVNNTAAGTAYVWSGNSNIVGSTGLVKSGDGTLNIVGESHTFSGDVQINGGTVGVQWINDSGLQGSLGTGSVITLNGGGISYDSLLPGYTNRSIILAGNGTVKVSDELVDLALDGVISGSGSFTKQGLGNLLINVNNSYTGDTVITAGTLTVGNGAANGTISNGAITNDGVLVLNRNVNFSLSQSVSGSGSIRKQTANLLTVPNENSYSGGTEVVAGTILMLHPSALGSGPITQSGGALRFSFGDGTTEVVGNDISLNTVGIQSFIIRGTADAAISLATTVRLTGKISGGAAGQTFRLVDSNTSGNHFNVLEVQNAANDFEGNVEMWRGTLAITSDAALGNAENDIIHFTENLNGSLRFDADNITLASTRDISLPGGANARPINTQAFTATIPGNISGTGILTKQGTGKLILTGTNSNTSATTVAAGTLQVDGTFATTTGVVTVEAGATLSGIGSIDRPITVTGSIAPGAGVGTLTTGAVTINGSYACEVNAATSDLIAATNVTLGAASALTVADTDGVFPRTIATYSGTLTGTFATVTSGYAVDYSTPGQIILRQGGYVTWASSNAGGGAADADSDNDGVPNGVEYFMGVNTPGFTSNPPIIDNEITWPKDNTVTDASYAVEYSTDLDQWTTATSGVTDSETTVKYTLPTRQSSYFVRLRVTIAP
jgi:autotransporter-associated beta strand protein